MLWSSLFIPLLAQATAPGTAANTAAGAAAEAWYNAPWILVLAAIATLVVPYIVGNALAKSMRMPDYGWKIGLILIALVAGVVIDIAGWPPKRGIDLSGGVKLVYEIDQEKLQEVNVDEIIRRIADEANKAGPFSKRNPAKVVPLKSGVIEVTLPTLDPDRVKKVEAALASLDLSTQSAQLSNPDARQEGQQTILQYRATRNSKAPSVDMDKLISAVSKRVNPGGQLEVAIRTLGSDQIEVDIPDVDASEIALIKNKISTAGALEFHIVADERAQQDSDIVDAARRQMQNPSDDVSNGQMIVGRWVNVAPNVKIEPFWLTRQGKNGLQVLMDTDGFGVTGQFLTDAQMQFGIRGPQVNFQFDSQGATKFGQLTGENLPAQNGLERWLGIVLDGQLTSAAVIQTRITSAGEITGNFTQPEVEFIVGVLNAGALPAALKKEPVSEEQISAELGRDTIHSSFMAMIVSGIAVLVFMLFYYRFAGIVADAAVVFNLVLVLAFMIMLKAAFTLAGLAGLVLSIGMAVDSNVLIYERMREEKERGAALRMVIRNGFGRAMATIIDMHSTTIITGLVLYLIGTEQLRGFAVTLVLGLLVNLFTAVFCARVVFDVAERKRWLTELKMLRLFGDTKIDFVRIMVPAICVSVLISVIGVAAFWLRSVNGPGMFDTDFTGGTEVHIVLRDNSPMTDAQVRALAEPDTKYLPDATVTAVEGKENRQFIIRTSNQDPDQVKDELVKLFGNKLQTSGISFEKLHTITAADVKQLEKATPESSLPAPPSEKVAPTTKGSTTPSSTPTAPASGANKSSSIGPSALRPLFAARALFKPAVLKSAIFAGVLMLADTSPAAATTNPPANTSTPPAASAADSASSDSKTPATKAKAADAAGATAPAAANTDSDKAADTKAPATTTPATTSATPPATTSPASTTSPATTPSTTTPSTTTPSTTTPSTTTPTTTAAPPSIPKTTPATPPPASPATAPASTTPPATTGAGQTSPNGQTTTNPAGSSMFTEGVATGPEAFIGGTETTLHFDQPVPYDGVEGFMKSTLGKDVRFELTNPKFQPGDRDAYNDWTLRVALPSEQARPLLEKFRGNLSKTPVFLGVSKIGGRVASDTQTTALYALLASIAMIVVYIWIRFQNVIYGVGAVVALIHDVFITVAALAISAYVAPYLGFLLVDPFKISLNVVAAILTICGYSISDTIVIFDRIREVRGKSPDLTPEIINLSVNQTLSRTVLTVFTVLLVTLILYTSGGQAIHAFAFTMLVGLISGTYSSVYIAAPCLLWMRNRRQTGTTRIQ